MSQKKKIFIFSEYLPYPLSHGGGIAQYYFLEQLVNDFDITYCSIIRDEQQEVNAKLLARELPNLKLDCYKELPNDTWKAKTATFISRANNKLKRFAKKILRSDYTSDDPCIQEAQLKYYSPSFICFLEHKMEEVKYDFVQIEFFDSITLLNISIPQDVKIVFIHHELRFKRISNSDLKSDPHKNYIRNTIKTIEYSILEKADAVVVFNEDDKKLLSDIGSEVIISPFGIPGKMICKLEASSTFNKFIFIGGSGHFPNREGLGWFFDKIYIPLYKKIEYPIYVIGNWDRDFRTKYKKYEKIIFTGFVPDIKYYYDDSILLCPILSGSGIRTKILEALANKIPVMSTRLGSEGLFDKTRFTDHLFHFENKDDFEKILKTVENNPELVAETANKGSNYYAINFNSIKLLEKRRQLYLKS